MYHKRPDSDQIENVKIKFSTTEYGLMSAAINMPSDLVQ